MVLEAVKKGRYHVLGCLGKGGMSEVYLVEDTTTGRHVALKLLLADVSSARLKVQRPFDDEVKMIVQLCYPNILPLLDSGDEVIDGIRAHFVVMPFCPDGSLAAWLENAQNYKGLSLQDVGRILRQSADALQYTHDHGIIHQNVKPSNILIGRGTSLQHLLLSDFRLATFLSESFDLSPSLVGSALYMAPEQWKGQPIYASDQYALAVMIYLLLTGRPPFQGSPEELMEAHLHFQPVSPSAINPYLSQGIDIMLLRALRKKSGDRFARVTDFANAFEQIIQPMAAPAMVMPSSIAHMPDGELGWLLGTSVQKKAP